MPARLRQRFTLIWTSLTSVLLLGGCASTQQTVLPQDGPSMQAIYQTHLDRTQAQAATTRRGERGPRPLSADDTHLAGFARDAFNAIETLFPRLPNPTLVMYVFPHLATEERVPVPGYATTFPMYERVEYALPGEVPHQPTQDRSTQSDPSPSR